MNKDDDPAPALGIRDALPATARPGHLVVPLSTIRAAGPKISTERASLQKIKSVVSIRESNLGTGDSEQQPENQTSRRGLATRRASARRRGSVHQVALRSVARLARRARMKRNSSSLSAEQQQDDGEGSDPDSEWSGVCAWFCVSWSVLPVSDWCRAVQSEHATLDERL